MSDPGKERKTKDYIVASLYGRLDMPNFGKKKKENKRKKKR